MGQVTDSQACTILVGEKAIDPQVQVPGIWYWDEPFFIARSASTTRYGVVVMRDAPGNTFKGNWGSAHSSAAQFLFVDGSVRPITYGLSWQTMSAMLTPAGGEVVPDM